MGIVGIGPADSLTARAPSRLRPEFSHLVSESLARPASGHELELPADELVKGRPLALRDFTYPSDQIVGESDGHIHRVHTISVHTVRVKVEGRCDSTGGVLVLARAGRREGQADLDGDLARCPGSTKFIADGGFDFGATPAVRAWLDRRQARPAWQRTIELIDAD